MAQRKPVTAEFVVSEMRTHLQSWRDMLAKFRNVAMAVSATEADISNYDHEIKALDDVAHLVRVYDQDSK